MKYRCRARLAPMMASLAWASGPAEGRDFRLTRAIVRWPGFSSAGRAAGPAGVTSWLSAVKGAIPPCAGRPRDYRLEAAARTRRKADARVKRLRANPAPKQAGRLRSRGRLPMDMSSLTIGAKYTRPELAERWGYESHHALGRGVVTPQGEKIILLFVTRLKQQALTQYVDYLSGD